jgi:hypothetical protein
MGVFFKGWRRKIGLLTLPLACVFMAGWVRSLHIEDTLDVIVGNHTFHEFHSTGNGVMWVWTWNSRLNHQEERPNGLVFVHKVLTKPFGWRIFATGRRFNWISTPIGLEKDVGDVLDYDYAKTSPAPRWYCNWIGMRFGVEGTPNVRGVIMTAHYWMFACPLTLFTAWLLLTKPRKLTQKKNTELIAVEGT